MRNRDVSLIVIGLFLGAIIGGVFGNLISWALPEGVVKDFFLTSFSFNIGGGTGNQNGVIIVGESTILNKLPASASNLYAKNLFNFVLNLYDKESKKININLEDEIICKTLVK